MTSRASLRSAVWQACTAIRNEHRDVKKYVEYTAVLLFFKFYDDQYDELPEDVQRLIPDAYRWKTLRALDPRGFGGYNPQVLQRFREFFNDKKWRGKAAFGTIFENFAFDIKHDEVLGKALVSLDRIDFAGMDYDQKGDLYEFLIAKMADAGVKGEFFTPRSIVNAIIGVLEPKAGMRVWDPACGTAGFLARAFEEMRSDLNERWPEGDVGRPSAELELRTRSIYGSETEAVSARLARMNMLLRGDGHSTVMEFNSLDRQTYAMPRIELRGERVANPLPKILSEGGFDLILGNPPYGGSQAVSDVGTLVRPWTSTKKPEANFLQVMMHALAPGGRCGVVLPEGVLFRRDELKIRERLLRDFDLEAVVGLYQGAFEFADVKACILFFRKPAKSEKWQGTRAVWIADTLTTDDIEQIPRRRGIDGDLGRTVPIDEITQRGLNLRPRYYLRAETSEEAPGMALGDLFERSKEVVLLQDGQVYRQVTVGYHGKGASLRGEVRGEAVATKRQFVVRTGDLVVSKIDARHGALALVPEDLDGGIVSADFPVLRFRSEELAPDLFDFYLRYGSLAERFHEAAQGTTNRQRINLTDILETVVPVPHEDEQQELLRRLRQQRRIQEQALALLAGVHRFEWLDEATFEVGTDDAVAGCFGPLIEDASEFVDPSQEPDALWQLYSLTNSDGVQPGDKKHGREFSPGRRYKRVVAGAIAYDTRRVNVGSVGLMPEGDDRSIVSPYRVVFRCCEGLDPRFVLYVMKSPFFLSRVREAQVGAVRDELFLNVFKEIPFRVPAADRQLQVVQQVEEQLAAYQRVRVIADQAEATMRAIVNGLFAGL